MSGISVKLLRVALSFVVYIGFCFLFLYNKEVLRKVEKLLGRISTLYTIKLASKVRALQGGLHLRSAISKDSLYGKVYRQLDSVLVNLDMKRHDVTVAGYLVFLVMSGVGVALLFSLLMSSVLMFPFAFAFGVYATYVITKYIGISLFEKREAAIMDAVDILIADIRGGVYNAIVRYQDSFPLIIKGSFTKFISNISEQGYDFKTAMLILNDDLGPQFDNFAKKAIYYEANANEGMEDIFSSIIDANRQRRIIRAVNNKKFLEFKVQFITSLLLIVGYATFSLAFDDFILEFLFHTFLGRVLLLCDVSIIVFVLARLMSIKTKVI